MRRYLIACLLLVLLFNSCKKKDLFVFNVKQSSDFTIQKTSIVDLPVVVQGPSIPVTSSSQYQNSKKQSVKEVTLEKLVLTITSPSNQTFSFLNSIRLFISADGVAEQEIAFKYDIPSTIGQTLELETTKIFLDEYLKKPSFTLRSEATVDETITQDVDVHAEMEFRVKAEL